MLFFVSETIVLLIALAVYVNNPRSAANRRLALLLAAAAVWFTGVLLPQFPQEALLAMTRVVFVAGVSMTFAIYRFVEQVSIESGRAKTRLQWLLSYILVAAVTLFTPLVIPSVSIIGEGDERNTQLERGQFYIFAAAWIVIALVLIMRRLWLATRATDGQKRRQLQIIFSGLVVASTLGVLTTVILPNIAGNSTPNQFVPLVGVVMGLSLSYAILKHKFLNIRFLVARSVTYVLLLGTLMLMFSAIVFGISQLIMENEGLSTDQQIIYGALALFIGYTYQPLKRFFDK